QYTSAIAKEDRSSPTRSLAAAHRTHLPGETKSNRIPQQQTLGANTWAVPSRQPTIVSSKPHILNTSSSTTSKTGILVPAIQVRLAGPRY
ncbi:hypothetical protein LTR22_028461, partial [Elasticomyces elasticus]